MEKLKTFCKISIKIIFVLFILLILISNIRFLSFDNSEIFFYGFLLIMFTLVIMWLYKRKFINKKIFYIIMILYLIFGIIIRIYFIKNLSFNLASDFDYVFQNAKRIMSGTLITSDNYYLSFNGYSYIYSLLISVLFNIFGINTNVVLYANIFCQLLSVYFLYKIISLKYSKETSVLISVIFFLLPTMIFANLLVSTETPFMLMFFITIYAFYKIFDKKDMKVKNFILYAFLGILMCLTNYIRPVMTIFIIAIIIYFVINMKKAKEILLLILLLFTYKITDITVNSYIEKQIGVETRSGALGWSIYFGSNPETCGMWSLEDSTYVFSILADETKGDKDLALLALDRYKKIGISKTADLISCKYRSLWTDNVGTYTFVNSIVNYEKSSIDFSLYNESLSSLSRIFVISISIVSVLCIGIEIKRREQGWLFLELFGIGYILSNLLVCLNGRYNLPLYPILLICCAPFIDRILIPKIKELKNKEITKIKNKEPKILLIIPAYNEEENIEKTIESIKKYNYDYIIINDGSTDNTESICIDKKYNFISLPSNLGIGGAVQTGYKYALKQKYDIAIQFDADGQHNIDDVKTIIKPIIKNKAHLVIGSRFVDKNTSDFKSTQLRRIGIYLISLLIRLFSKKQIYDTTSGFRAANIDVIKMFAKYYPTEYPEPISTFELLKKGYEVNELPVKMFERQGGSSSIVSWKKVYYMINVYLSIIVVHIRGDK